MKKVLLKVYSFILTIMLVLGIMPTGAYISYAASSSVDTQATDDGIQYFPVTLYNYDTSVINQMAGSNGLQFNNGKGTGYNGWTGAGGGADTGLAKSKFENGTIAFNVPQGGIFTSSNVGKKSYKGVQLPFTKDSDGYYTFDSSKNDAYFKDNPGNDLTLITSSRTFDSINVASGVKSGFFPFNNASSTSSSAPIYHFGMAMTTNFYTTNDGKVNGKDMTFEFTGDDDVWVFVDGNLVLDLGGIHDPVSGSVNFATGKITCNRAVAGKVSGTTGGSTMGGNLYANSVLGAKDVFLRSDKPHTLQVFYLERGEGASNCRIKFNMPPPDTLEISKSLDSATSNSTDKESIEDQVYTFTVKKDGELFKSKPYILYDRNNSEIEGNYTTSDEGELTLQEGQTARFFDFEDGIYVVTEKDDSTLYTSSWQHGTSDSLSDGNKYDIIKNRQGTSYRFICTNTIKPQLVNDAVVIDFGKTLTIDVLNNDKLYGKTGTLSIDSSSLTQGKAVVAYNKVKYTPTKFMDKVDTATYSYGGSNAKVSVMPASSVYYEDNFSDGTIVNGKLTTVIKYGEGWNAIGEDKIDSILGDKEYGSDTNYANNLHDSGTVYSVTAGDTAKTAEFEFTGTGIDIYSRVTDKTGKVKVELYDGTTRVARQIINSVSVDGDRYQIPVFSFNDLTRKTYTVKITVYKGQTYYLDGVRIYNPISEDTKVDLDKNKDTTVGDIYDKDGEANAKLYHLRNNTLNSISNVLTLTGQNWITKYTNSQGEVVEAHESTVGSQESKVFGPTNEIYLNKEQEVTLRLKDTVKFKSLQLGVKTIEGASKVTINETETKLNSANDMFVKIDGTSRTITIKNTGSKIVSLTYLKVVQGK